MNAFNFQEFAKQQQFDCSSPAKNSPEIPKPWMKPVTTLLPFDWSATGPRQIFNEKMVLSSNNCFISEKMAVINECFQYRCNKKWFEDNRPLGARQCDVIWTLEQKAPALLPCYQNVSVWNFHSPQKVLGCITDQMKYKIEILGEKFSTCTARSFLLAQPHWRAHRGLPHQGSG